MMKPTSKENPVAMTPKTPEARSPLLKKLPSGACRRTSSMTEEVAAAAARTRSAPTRTFTGHPRSSRPLLPRVTHRVEGHSRSKDQDGIDVRGDLHAVGVP